MRRRDLVTGTVALVLAHTLPALAQEKTADAVRAEIRKMRQETLDQLYKDVPQARRNIRGAAGYAVFESVGAQVLFVGGAGGSGVVRDNLTGKDTYMKMASAGVGLGLGVKDTRLVFVFKKRDALKHFVDEGWQFGGQTSAAAKSDAQGASSGQLEVADGITVYQLTKTGLIAQASVQGTKYWKDETLN